MSELDRVLFQNLQEILFEKRHEKIPVEYVERALVCFRDGTTKEMNGRELKTTLDESNNEVVEVRIIFNLKFIHSTINEATKKVIKE